MTIFMQRDGKANIFYTESNISEMKIVFLLMALVG